MTDLNPNLNPLRAPSLAWDATSDRLRWHREDRTFDYWRRVEHAAERPLIASSATKGEPAAIALTAQACRESLTGRVIWISGHAGSMIEDAAADIPSPDGGQLGAGTITDQAGIAWLSDDPAMCYYDDPIRAVSWVVRPWPGISVDGEKFQVGSVVIFPWLDSGQPERPTPAPPVVLPLGADAARMIPDDYGSQWVEGRSGFGEWQDQSRDLPRWTLAMWVLCGQVLPRLITQPQRAARRRRARLEGATPPESSLEIHATTLRVIDADAIERGEAGEDGRYSHQWVVRGHWRWQRCGEGGQDRRLTWVRPHVKGPDGAPLIQVEQIGKLVR